MLRSFHPLIKCRERLFRSSQQPWELDEIGARRGCSGSIEIRAEVFNLLNTPNFGAPNAVLGAANFGIITTALDPRVVQLALKFVFQEPASNSAAGCAGSKSARWRPARITGLSEPRVDPTALFRAIVESADDAIISTDLQETITSWNQAAERLYGYSAAETIGKSNRMIIPPDRCAEEDAVVRRLRSGEGVQHFETVRIHKNGTRVDVAITASAVRSDGSIIGISKIARDISSRKDSRTQRCAALGDRGIVRRCHHRQRREWC